MEGHAEMDMSVQECGSWWRRLKTQQGVTATANYFVIDCVIVIARWSCSYVGRTGSRPAACTQPGSS
jgi:hypothetical protein